MIELCLGNERWGGVWVVGGETESWMKADGSMEVEVASGRVRGEKVWEERGTIVNGSGRKGRRYRWKRNGEE